MPTLLADDREINCKLLIFDKDGTIVEQKPHLLYLAKARFSSLAKLIGAQVAEKWAKAVGVDLHAEEIDNDGPLAMAPTSEEVLVAALIIHESKSVGWDIAKELAEKAYREADKTMTPPFGAVLIRGTYEALQALKTRGFKMAIATTARQKRAKESLKKLKLDTHFKVVVGADDVAHGKPAPDMILKACTMTGCSPRDTVMIGDSHIDMMMGKNARVKACIGVLTGSDSREKLQKVADIVVPSVASLRNVK